MPLLSDFGLGILASRAHWGALTVAGGVVVWTISLLTQFELDNPDLQEYRNPILGYIFY